MDITVRLDMGDLMSLDKRFTIVVEAALSKKAANIRLIDVSEIANFTNTFIFMSGSSDRHNRAIADTIEEALRLNSERCIAREGVQNGNWILLDYGDIMIHIISEELRDFYKLEELWKLGREIEFLA
jgi:ribosome-associated protein